MTFQHRDEAIFGLDRLLYPKERLQDRLDWLERRKNPQFGQRWDFQRSNNVHTLRTRLDYLAQIEGALAEADDEEPPNTETIDEEV